MLLPGLLSLLVYHSGPPAQGIDHRHIVIKKLPSRLPVVSLGRGMFSIESLLDNSSLCQSDKKGWWQWGQDQIDLNEEVGVCVGGKH